MAEWHEKECKDFDLYETEDGWYYQAVGTENNRVEIQASEIIKALDDIAISKNKDIKGIRIYYGRIDGDLNIEDAEKLIKEDGTGAVKLPVRELIFLHTVFDGMTFLGCVQFGNLTIFDYSQFRGRTFFISAKFGAFTTFNNTQFEEKIDFNHANFDMVNFHSTKFGNEACFQSVQFGKYTSFRSAEFGKRTDFISAEFGKKTDFSFAQFGKITDFSSAQFKLPATFSNIRYWSDSPKVTLAHRLWKDGKLLRRILPPNSPEGKPEKPAQFALDNQNVDEVSNPHFKKYVADQQFIRQFKEKYPFWYCLWRWSSDCGRSIFLWAGWALTIAFLFSCAYSHYYWIFGIISLAIGCICLEVLFQFLLINWHEEHRFSISYK